MIGLLLIYKQLVDDYRSVTIHFLGNAEHCHTKLIFYFFMLIFLMRQELICVINITGV